MSEKKPYMDIESEFDPDLVYIVRKYSCEDAKWHMEHGFKDIVKKYSDLDLPKQDLIEAWKNVETGINKLADLAEVLEEYRLPAQGITIEQLFESKEELQAYLDLTTTIKEMLVKYDTAKDAIIVHYNKLASAAVILAGESNVYKELEKKEFRNKVYKTVFPTLDEGLAALKELQKKSDQANDAYTSYLLFIKNDPIISQMTSFEDSKTEPLGKRKSFSEECKIFVEEKIKEIYKENE